MQGERLAASTILPKGRPLAAAVSSKRNRRRTRELAAELCLDGRGCQAERTVFRKLSTSARSSSDWRANWPDDPNTSEAAVDVSAAARVGLGALSSAPQRQHA